MAAPLRCVYCDIDGTLVVAGGSLFHDAAGDVKAGDLVRIQESRPFSATKHWQIVEVLSRAGEAGAAAPRAEDFEKLLEQAEGVDVILAPQREEKVAEPVAEGTAE